MKLNHFKAITILIKCAFILLYTNTFSQVNLLKAIDPENSSQHAFNSVFFPFNNLTYFGADNNIEGNVLWRSDGTTTGTYMFDDKIKDPTSFVEMNGLMYFFGNDDENGSVLRKTDGTEAGTTVVSSINTRNNVALFNHDNILYFGANDGIHGLELWRSDGTEAGTYLLKDLNVGDSESDSYPKGFVAIGNTLFFYAKAGLTNELFVTDGTDAGTVQISNIDMDSPGVSNLCAYDNRLFFSLNSTLWVSDGTNIGTYKFDPTGSVGTIPYNLKVCNGFLYYFALHPSYGFEVWKTDGTVTGTVCLDILPGSNGSVNNNSSEMIVLNNEVYFSISGLSSSGFELWKTDGVNTSLVKDIYPGSNSSNIKYLTKMNGELYFQAEDNISGRELWKSDGTTYGTVLLKDTYAGFLSGDPTKMQVSNNLIFFTATYTGSGIDRKLWVSDGTTVGTNYLKEIAYNNNISFSTKQAINFNGNLYFSPTTATTATKLYISDGTTSGTNLLHNVVTNNDYAFPYGSTFLEFKNNFYFAGNYQSSGFELWKSDGTSAGTNLFKSFESGSSGGNPANFVKFEDYFLFRASNKLYRSDGTIQGTNLIDKPGLTLVNSITKLNNEVVFIGTKYNSNYLMKSDGTVAGTEEVFLFNSTVVGNVFGLVFKDFVSTNTLVFFTLNTSLGRELWRTDGTTAGTYLLKDINPGAAESNVNSLTVKGDLIYFSANDGINGQELWVSDGTLNGTTMLKDIYPGAKSSFVSNIININDILYFRANDGVTGFELWKSDGTEAGTGLIKDINPGLVSSYPTNLKNAHGTLYFSAKVGLSGSELWKSHGSLCNTIALNDINPETSYGSLPIYLESANGISIFYAYSCLYGWEPWEYDDPQLINIQACNSYTWSQNNQTYTNTGYYYDTLTSAFGCDSIITLDLIIHSSTDTTSQVIACDSYTWSVNGIEYISSGIYYDSLVSVYGCDSVLRLNLTISGTSNYDTLLVNSCGSYTWTQTGLEYVNSGFYTDTLQNSTGCDSLIILNLQINTSEQIETIHACESYLWDYNGVIYSLSGTYSDTLTNSFGCDSIITLALTIHQSYQITETVSYCAPYYWYSNEMIYDSTGIYYDSLLSVNGCDSIMIFDFTMSSQYWDIDIFETACDSFYYDQNGITYTSSGVYLDTIADYNCHYIYILHLIINPSFEQSDTVVACGDYTWGINGLTYNSSGIYSYTQPNSLGCDSIHHLLLTIIHSTTSSETIQMCDHYYWNQTGIDYTESGQYIDTTLTSFGCDSIFILNLTINNSSNTIENISSNENSYYWNITGLSYYLSGTYTDSFSTIAGCDSILTLNLNLFNLEVNTFSLPSDQVICNGGVTINAIGTPGFNFDLRNGTNSANSNGYAFMQDQCSGIYSMLTQDGNGDTLSTIVVIPVDSNYVFINPFVDSLAVDSLGVTFSNCTIYYNSIDTAYIESLFSNGNIVNVVWNIIDSTGSNYDTTTYILNNGYGVYYVQLNIYCPQKSMGKYFTVTQAIYFGNEGAFTLSTNSLTIDFNLSIFPNPTEKSVTITFNEPDLDLMIYDIQGKLLKTQKILDGAEVSIKNYENGTYLFKLIGKNKVILKKVIKR